MALDVEQGRAARFLARLDRHLAALADPSARRGFLERQLAGWEHRYARFVATEGASEPVGDEANPPQASDFLLTIAELAARRRALAARPVDASGGESFAMAKENAFVPRAIPESASPGA